MFLNGVLAVLTSLVQGVLILERCFRRVCRPELLDTLLKIVTHLFDPTDDTEIVVPPRSGAFPRFLVVILADRMVALLAGVGLAGGHSLVPSPVASDHARDPPIFVDSTFPASSSRLRR